MPRDYRLYLDDILEAVRNIRQYTDGRLPAPQRARSADIEWRKIVGLRNLLSHEYFGVSLPVVWDVLQNKLGPLEIACRHLLEDDQR